MPGSAVQADPEWAILVVPRRLGVLMIHGWEAWRIDAISGV
jgi:hypothetical protein